MNVDAVIGLESRGFVLGGAIAYNLNIPFIPIRKKGKLPGKVVSYKYDLEYGSVCLFLALYIITLIYLCDNRSRKGHF